MEFHVQYYMELSRNTTSLHGVFMRFRPSGIAMENVCQEDSMGLRVKYSMEFP